MLEKILLDTNMLIYLEDDHILNKDVARLTRILYDSSNYKIVIHPDSILETNKIKDVNRKNIFQSKIRVYKQINNPPRASEAFQSMLGYKNENDKIDNELLFAVKQNCVSYFVTNDNKLKGKGIRIGLGDRVLNIKEAIEKFEKQEMKEILVPVFIKKEELYRVQLEDPFFNSLKKDYFEFDKWFERKQREGEKAYIVRNQKNEVTAFLMLKIEEKGEEYEEFEKKFSKKRRLKVSTFKVDDTGKRIGETFIKIIVENAIKEKVEEIYVTVFPKYNFLIDLFKEYGFKYYTYKQTPDKRKESSKEYVLVKSMKDKESYPFVNIEKRKVFIVPIQPIYHRLFFPEAIKNLQYSINDYEGINTESNAIRKAYISNSNIKKIQSGDVLLFYASQKEKAITCAGIVDTVFSDFKKSEEIVNLVRKRTAYSERELQNNVDLNSLVIMFKHYMTFNKEIAYKELRKWNIINGAIQSITEIDGEKIKELINRNEKDSYYFK